MINEAALAPILTTYRFNIDHNQSDAILEAQSLLNRNTAIEDFLLSNVDVDYLFDSLAEAEINPNAYWQSVEDDIEYLIANPKQLYA